MSWAKLDDGFADHIKVRTVGDAAFRLHVTALCFCCKFGTNGKLGTAIPETLTRAPRAPKLSATIAELEQAGLWDAVEGGWLVHDFLDWNPTADQAKTKHEARQAAGKRGGKRSAEERAKRKQPTKQLLDDSEANGEAKLNPVPVPVPVPAAAAAAEPPLRSCPGDLWDRMPEASIATLETAFIPRWAQEQICKGFAARYAGRSGDLRNLDAWISGAITAIQGTWNDPNKRPKQSVAPAPAQKPPDEEPKWL